jgi:ribosomal protein S12 methylthiotransferase
MQRRAENKIHFTSLGCSRNWVDSEVMLGILLQAGYEVAPAMQEADYLVVNTCGFLQEARDEGKDTIREMIDEKKQGSKLIVTGCMINLHRDEILTEFPDIDILLGSGAVPKILQAIESTIDVGNSNRIQESESIKNQETEKASTTQFLDLGPDSAKSYLEDGEIPRQVATPSHYGYLKIAEGCRKKCAFCIIPKIKGPFHVLRSRMQLYRLSHARFPFNRPAAI